MRIARARLHARKKASARRLQGNVWPFRTKIALPVPIAWNTVDAHCWKESALPKAMRHAKRRNDARTWDYAPKSMANASPPRTMIANPRRYAVITVDAEPMPDDVRSVLTFIAKLPKYAVASAIAWQKQMLVSAEAILARSWRYAVVSAGVRWSTGLVELRVTRIVPIRNHVLLQDDVGCNKGYVFARRCAGRFEV